MMKLVRGVTVASITMKAFNEMVNTFSCFDSRFNPDILLIDGGSDINLA